MANLAGSLRLKSDATVNGISLRSLEMRNSRLSVLENQAQGQLITHGGVAAINSIWLTQATLRNSPVYVAGNIANDVSASGSQATLGLGAIGSFDQRGQALANSVAASGQATLEQASILLSKNSSSNIRGNGGQAAAGSVLLSGAKAKVSGSTITLSNNQATGVHASGFGTALGGGLLYSAAQDAQALAGSLGVFDSSVDASQVLIAGNRAERLTAQGGKLVANTVSVEGLSTLSAPTSLTDNTALQVQTAAGSGSGALGLASRSGNARAATNAVVLNGNATANRASGLTLQGNSATGVRAVSGTALANTLAAYRGARIEGSTIALMGNTAENINAGGGAGQAFGLGKASNGILVANGVYLDGDTAVTLNQTPVRVLDNQARNVHADGGRINANALAINGAGSVQGASLTVAGNSAEDIRSQGSETTVAGMAVNKGVGATLANAVQVLGRWLGGHITLFDNTAQDIAASKGQAIANSVATNASGHLESSSVRVSGNDSRTVRADSGKTALAASLHTDGQVTGSTVTLTGNTTTSATSGEHDALASSVRNGSGASLTSSQVAVTGNGGSVQSGGSVNSLDNQRGQINASTVNITGNDGNATAGGTVNSVTNRNRIQSSEIMIANNQGQAKREGTVNSVENEGVVQSSRITISDNVGKAEGGGLVNSVRNKDRIQNAKISITGNHGSSQGAGTVNSVDNTGLLTGGVMIANNTGHAVGGGTINSLINRGQMSGEIIIARNQGGTTAGGISNSVVNNGTISGKVMIGSSAPTAGQAATGIVRVKGGRAGNGDGPADGVINRTVTVGNSYR